MRRTDDKDGQTTYVYKPPSHRLLYRGSLLIEGSTLLLDGLSFSVPLKDATGSNNINLLDNPLALALESMRGRSLLLLGDAQTREVHLDRSGEVSVDVHPSAVITKLYFENQLCSRPITSANGTTDTAIRIAVGDPDNPETTEILVYGQLPPSSPSADDLSASSSSSIPVPCPESPPVLRLVAARILPKLPQTPSVRLPRPDDPSPRMPPPALVYPDKRAIGDEDPFEAAVTSKRRKNSNEATPSAKGKGKSKAIPGDGDILGQTSETKARLPKGAGVGMTGEGSNGGRTNGKQVAFKIPLLPSEVRGEPDIVKELEKANKGVIKKASIDCLATYGIGKTHPEWKDLWHTIYRGSEFALRAQMRVRAVDGRTVDKLVKAHARLYVHDRDQQSISPASRLDGDG